MKIIDISHHQGSVDFNRVKNAGYEGVILKAGGSDAGFYKDSRFEEYYQGAKNAGLHVGSYYFVGKYCLSTQDGIEDAQRFADYIAGKQFDLPVYMDVEAPASGQKNKVTDAIEGFCNELENRGYYVGVYASDISGFKEKIDYPRIANKYDIWVARYGSKPQYVQNYQIWQYSGSGKVDGINDNQVDLDECYVDYPTIIIQGGYNGYSAQPQPTSPDLRYKAHIQDIGWTDWQDAGTVEGTTGECKRIEAVIFEANNGLDIQYRAHVENIGWMDWVKSGEVAGTTGQCLRLEALEIKSNRTLSVQEHLAEVGWLPPSVGTDVVIGTTGKSLRMEAIKIDIL